MCAPFVKCINKIQPCFGESGSHGTEIFEEKKQNKTKYY